MEGRVSAKASDRQCFDAVGRDIPRISVLRVLLDDPLDVI
jgi:hypothetical protein